MSILRKFSRMAEEDAENGKNSHNHGIVEIADDASRGDAGKAGGHKQLCTIRNETLSNATEGVQNAGTFAVVHSKTGGNVVGDRA